MYSFSSQDFPVLIIDDELHADTGGGRATRAVVAEFRQQEYQVIESLSAEDAEEIASAYPNIGAVLIDWDLKGSAKAKGKRAVSPAARLVMAIRSRNEDIPILLMTEKHRLADIEVATLSKTNGYLWKMEDTPTFIVGKVLDEIKEYYSTLLPPFFKELMTYTSEYKYAWHTPGHMGGLAFRKSAPGRIFFDFYGENSFRADLSVSVPELGSLNEHSGVVGEAEAHASKVFGSDHTFFVTNGTSGANKIVFHGCVSPGDVVIADRNCHKSIMHAIVMTGAIPLYFIPTRNAQGIIGPIHRDEFAPATIKKKLAASKLTRKLKNPRIKIAVVTNSTYDGLCYNTVYIKEQLKNQVENLHFDEAWYGYANAYPLYEDRYGMCMRHDANNHPTVFATQSTHKVLAAFSQASMVHYKNGRRKLDPNHFNEAFMMHTSTSPQYSLIASLDVASKMMEGYRGHAVVEDSIEEAIVFRKKMVGIGKELAGASKASKKSWWFPVWQPALDRKSEESLKKDPGAWTLDKGAKWHGFGGMEKNYIMLDPIKVTILSPGINQQGKMDSWGIPAGIVSRFLWSRGIVVEKTGFYSFLCLFTIGITKGKSGTLLAELFAFKEFYDRNAPLEEIFPELVSTHPQIYAGLKLQDLCDGMHAFLRKAKITEVMQEVYAKLPEQEMIPAQAYAKLVENRVEDIPLKKMQGRTSAVMIVPYPPGIPILMPGEKFTPATQDILDYLSVYEEFDNRYPGFECEIHGITVKEEKGRKTYYAPFLK